MRLLTVMLEKKLLEQHLPDIKIERLKFLWRGRTRSHDCRPSGCRLHGIPPFLVGWDKGVDWKIAGGLGSMPLLLLTYKENIKGIRDLQPSDKIALPGPGSNQHILLAMEAEKTLGDGRALDDLILAMPHPDAATALLTQQDVTCYYGAPPYQYELLKNQVFPGDRQFYRFRPPFSYQAVASSDFYQRQPEAYEAFCSALKRYPGFMNQHQMNSRDTGG